MKLTQAQIVEELRGEIRMYQESYAVRGVVKEQDVRRTITALKTAIQILNRQTRKPRR
jgi:hypothetical protein